MHIQILRAEKAGKDLRAARFHQVEQLVRGVIVSLRGRDRLVDVVDDETVRGAVPRLDGRAEEPPVEADRLAVLDKEVLRPPRRWSRGGRPGPTIRRAGS